MVHAARTRASGGASAFASAFTRAAKWAACFRTKSLLSSISACGAVVVALRRAQFGSSAGAADALRDANGLLPRHPGVHAAARLAARRPTLPGRVLDGRDRRAERRGVEPAGGDEHPVAHRL